MRKHLLLTILVFNFLVACKKNGSPSADSYHFSATIDGQAYTYIKPVALTAGISVHVIEDNLEGFSEIDTVNPTIRLMWRNISANTIFGVGTWSDTSTNYEITGAYLVTPYEGYGAGNFVAALAADSGVHITNHLTIIVTAMDGTSVKGTFSGDFYYEATPTVAKKTITGDFYLPWK